MTETSTKPSDTAVYWFVKLELAVERGDTKAALHAQSQLRRLGVLVEYHDSQTTGAEKRKAVGDAI